jgi:hypothetical protein
VVVLLACILEMSCSDLGLYMDCRVFRAFYKSLQANVKIGRDHFLPHTFETVVYAILYATLYNGAPVASLSNFFYFYLFIAFLQSTQGT